MASEVGNISIKLTADEASFYKSLANLKKATENIHLKLKVSADTVALNNSVANSISKLNNSKASTLKINADNIKALSQIDQVKARLDVLTTRASEVNLKPNVSDSSLKNLELQIGSTKSRLEGLSAGGLGGSFTNLAGIAGSALSSISNGLNQVANAGRIAALAIGSGLAIAFISASKNALQLGGSLQQSKADLEVLLGSQTEALKVIKEQKKFASVTPFKSSDLIKTASALSTVTKNTDDLNNRTKQLAELSGGSAVRLDNLALAYTQVAGKGRLMGQELNQLTENGFFNLRSELVKVTGIALPDLSKAIESGQVSFEDLNKAITNATVGFPRLEAASKTLNGIASTASEAFDDLGLSLIGIDTTTFEAKAGGIADIVLKLLKSFNSPDVQKKIGTFGENIGNSIAKLFGEIDINSLVGNITNSLPSIARSFDNVIKSIKDFINIIAKAYNQVVAFVGGQDNLNAIVLATVTTIGALTGAMTLLQLATSPITLTIAGIALALTGIATIVGNGDIQKGFSTMFDTLLMVGQKVKPFIENLIATIRNFFSNFIVSNTINKIFESLVFVGSKFIELVRNAINFVGNLLSGAGSNDRLVSIFNSVVEILGSVASIVGKVIGFFADLVSKILENQTFMDNLKLQFEALGVIADIVLKAISFGLKILDGDSTVFAKSIEGIVSAFEFLKNGALNVIRDIKNFFLTKINEMIVSATPILDILGIKIEQIALDTSDAFATSTASVIANLNAIDDVIIGPKITDIIANDKATNTINVVKSGLASVPTNINSILSSTANSSSAINSSRSLVNTAQSFANANPVFIRAVADSTANIARSTAAALGGFSKGGEAIPKFATGGFASKSLVPQGEDFIAGLRNNEYVVNNKAAPKYNGLLNTLNFDTPKFDDFMRNVAKVANLAGGGSNINNKTNNLNIDINIDRVEGSANISRTVQGIGYLLQNELLNRGL